jgi:hypothetical protein
MAWAVITHNTNDTTGRATAQDYVVNHPVWEEAQWNTPLGSSYGMLFSPLPSARGTLDDETVITAMIITAGPSVSGGRRAREWDLRRKHAFQLTLDYQQKTPWLWPYQTWPPEAAKGTQELLPVRMQQEQEWDEYFPTMVQEGLKKVHPSTYPVQHYRDDMCRILSEVQRHLLEPVIDGGLTWQLWTKEEVQAAVLFRLNRFLHDTDLIRKEVQSQAQSGTMQFPEDLITLRRLQWEYDDRSQKPRALTRTDQKIADLTTPDWDETVSGEPLSYTESPFATGTPGVRTVPIPDAPGDLNMRYVPLQDLDLEACPPSPIPRMFTWVVKWGLISDLLKKEGEANDPVRAAHAEQIYKFGVGIAKALLGGKHGEKG